MTSVGNVAESVAQPPPDAVPRTAGDRSTLTFIFQSGQIQGFAILMDIQTDSR